MKVRDDQMCSYCNDVVDYTEHFFFDCPTMKKCWNYIEQYILITFDIIIIIIDRFYIALFSAVEQTHCARM